MTSPSSDPNAAEPTAVLSYATPESRRVIEPTHALVFRSAQTSEFAVALIVLAVLAGLAYLGIVLLPYGYSGSANSGVRLWVALLTIGWVVVEYELIRRIRARFKFEGHPIRIAISDDTLEISSPGQWGEKPRVWSARHIRHASLNLMRRKAGRQPILALLVEDIALSVIEVKLIVGGSNVGQLRDGLKSLVPAERFETNLSS